VIRRILARERARAPRAFQAGRAVHEHNLVGPDVDVRRVELAHADLRFVSHVLRRGQLPDLPGADVDRHVAIRDHGPHDRIKDQRPVVFEVVVELRRTDHLLAAGKHHVALEVRAGDRPPELIADGARPGQGTCLRRRARFAARRSGPGIAALLRAGRGGVGLRTGQEDHGRIGPDLHELRAVDGALREVHVADRRGDAFLFIDRLLVAAIEHLGTDSRLRGLRLLPDGDHPHLARLRRRRDGLGDGLADFGRLAVEVGLGGGGAGGGVGAGLGRLVAVEGYIQRGTGGGGAAGFDQPRLTPEKHVVVVIRPPLPGGPAHPDDRAFGRQPPRAVAELETALILDDLRAVRQRPEVGVLPGDLDGVPADAGGQEGVAGAVVQGHKPLAEDPREPQGSCHDQHRCQTEPCRLHPVTRSRKLFAPDPHGPPPRA